MTSSIRVLLMNSPWSFVDERSSQFRLLRIAPTVARCKLALMRWDCKKISSLLHLLSYTMLIFAMIRRWNDKQSTTMKRHFPLNFHFIPPINFASSFVRFSFFFCFTYDNIFVYCEYIAKERNLHNLILVSSSSLHMCLSTSSARLPWKSFFSLALPPFASLTSHGIQNEIEKAFYAIVEGILLNFLSQLRSHSIPNRCSGWLV